MWRCVLGSFPAGSIRRRTGRRLVYSPSLSLVPLHACVVNTFSMNAEKLDRARKAKALRVAQTEEGMLGTFVRLVDYVCVEMIAAGVTSQLRLFLRELIGACPAALPDGLELLLKGAV